MDTLLIVTQTPQGEEIPLKVLYHEHGSILEVQAQAMGMDLAGWVSLLLETGNTIYPDDIEPGREVEPVEQPPGARRVQLTIGMLERLAGKEWSLSPHVGVTDWIGVTCALAAMDPENGAAARVLAAQGQTACQVAHALLTMEWEDIEALVGTYENQSLKEIYPC